MSDINVEENSRATPTITYDNVIGSNNSRFPKIDKEPMANVGLTMEQVNKHAGSVFDEKEVDILTRAINEEPLSDKQKRWVESIVEKIAKARVSEGRVCDKCNGMVYPFTSKKGEDHWVCRNKAKHSNGEDHFVRLPSKKK